MPDKKHLRVIDGPLGIRDVAGGTAVAGKLADDLIIEVDVASRAEVNGYVWWKHNKGWSAERSVDGLHTFMTEVTQEELTGPRTFTVVASQISIRDVPNGKKLPEKLKYGTQITVKAEDRAEAGGYIWWKHEKGWSAQRNVSGNEILMKESRPKPPVQANGLAVGKSKVELPAHLMGKKLFLQVAKDVKIRAQPNTDTRGTIIKTIKRGATLEVDTTQITEADGYYWVKNASGWSAWTSLDGTDLFLAEPGTIPGLVAVGENGPKMTDIPGYKEMIKRLPVDIGNTKWFQYYGNNMWAFTNGKAYGYDKYSQGLHGGLDFGNSDKSGIPVFAGIEGTFVKVDATREKNYQIWVKKGDLVYIYQHIINMRPFSPNQAITPDTQLGEIHHSSQGGGWDHLHFEIRFMNDWILNPLLFMPDELLESITAKFDPNKGNVNWGKTDTELNFFYKSPKWGEWYTPTDQPCIKLAGPVIGPQGKPQQRV